VCLRKKYGVWPDSARNNLAPIEKAGVNPWVCGTLLDKIEHNFEKVAQANEKFYALMSYPTTFSSIVRASVTQEPPPTLRAHGSRSQSGMHDYRHGLMHTSR